MPASIIIQFTPGARKWRPRHSSDRYVLVEAMAWLELARVARLALSFKHSAPYLGARMALAREELPDQWAEEARRVSWAIRATAPHTPWKSNCLGSRDCRQSHVEATPDPPHPLYWGWQKGK